ncbi:MAG: hypothetical protein ACRC3Y_03935 [Romboutsia sp.]|uniref:hypothetical protein n=1 Tax=Romboutsia sp. TaxID=1965302 RepID=UPI003F310FAF
MKKYKSINFLEKDKKEKKNIKLYSIAIITVIAYLTVIIYNDLNNIKDLQSYIDENKDYEQEVIPVMSYEEPSTIDMNIVREIYSKLGEGNIIYIVSNNSEIEVEGKCIDLNILNSIKKSQYVSSMSINKIKKEGEAYIFNVSYSLSE